MVYSIAEQMKILGIYKIEYFTVLYWSQSTFIDSWPPIWLTNLVNTEQSISRLCRIMWPGWEFSQDIGVNTPTFCVICPGFCNDLINWPKCWPMGRWKSGWIIQSTKNTACLSFFPMFGALIMFKIAAERYKWHRNITILKLFIQL